MKRLLIFLMGTVLLPWAFAATLLADVKPVQEPEEVLQVPTIPPSGQTGGAPVPAQLVSPQAFQLNWLSINGGGAINASSTNYRLGLSVGQSVAGFGTSPSYQMGIGFWYGAAPGAPVCASARGDLNGNTIFDPPDVSLLLLCVFVGTGSCEPCFADVNCNTVLDPPDVVAELLAVFVSGSLPPCP